MTTLEDLLEKQRREWSEESFTDELVKAAAQLGWKRAHVESVNMQARGRMIHKTPMAPGWPDEVWHRHGCLIIVEVKAEAGTVSTKQQHRLTEISGYTPKDKWASRGKVPTGTLSFGSARALDMSTLLPERAVYVAVWRPRHYHHAIDTFNRLRL